MNDDYDDYDECDECGSPLDTDTTECQLCTEKRAAKCPRCWYDMGDHTCRDCKHPDGALTLSYTRTHRGVRTDHDLAIRCDECGARLNIRCNAIDHQPVTTEHRSTFADVAGVRHWHYDESTAPGGYRHHPRQDPRHCTCGHSTTTAGGLLICGRHGHLLREPIPEEPF